ncbi:MAG: polyphenol oxidase family protein [Candidatus Margulisbacteria bacterium]|nr:polyphenol oxidase family protein [Candidatus Margulisiibacteriota bacterium]
MTLVYSSSDKQTSADSICQQLNINPKDLASAEQIHGNGIIVITAEDRGKKVPQVDALITKEKNLPIMIRTADCAPILIHDTKREILALVHAGRKGTALKITHKIITKLKDEFSSDPKDLTVKIGPCIDKCCYPMDLRRENKEQLLKAGVPEENIKINKECTKCNNHKYFSYRGDGPHTGRMFLIAAMIDGPVHA